MGATFLFVEVACPDEALVRGRLAARAHAPCESDARDGERALVRASAEPLSSEETYAHLKLDTREPPAAVLDAALAALRPAGVLPATERSRS
jgi:hypothetical protein